MFVRFLLSLTFCFALKSLAVESISQSSEPPVQSLSLAERIQVEDKDTSILWDVLRIISILCAVVGLTYHLLGKGLAGILQRRQAKLPHRIVHRLPLESKRAKNAAD